MNSLSGFAVAAGGGLGTILGILFVMLWVEQALLGPDPRRGRHRDQRAAARRSVPGKVFIPAMRAVGGMRRSRPVVSAGGPGAMRRPGPRHSFDPPIARGSRRSRTPATPRR
ncbi:hypothetical protein [Saccharopolyspora griseoalba]|uniref:Uncharacterized protein n=1 Tax=Saccharopolyspora griseoalba TaxID=1431848 RepID=A0ABW2LRZ6_9PSEU